MSTISFHEDDDVFVVGFDCRLHTRGSDFWVYTSQRYVPMHNDSSDLEAVLTALCGFSSGVEKIHVWSFQLHVYHSRAVSFAHLRKLVLDALQEEGSFFTEVGTDGLPLELDDDEALEVWYGLSGWQRLCLRFSEYGPENLKRDGQLNRSRTQLREDYLALPLWKRIVLRFVGYPFN